MIEINTEYYQRLEKGLESQRRWFTAALLGLAICLGLAFQAGPSDGWAWMLGSILAIFVALWSRIDEAQTVVLMKIYLANAK